MKKVLKIVLVLALALALSVSVFAASASPEIQPGKSGNDAPDEYVSRRSGSGSSGNSSSAPVGVSATAPTGITVIIEAPTASYDAANMAFFRGRNSNIVDFLNGFDMIVLKDGVEIHNGATVNLTLTGLGNYVGKTLNLVENTNGATTVAYSGPITGDAETIALSSFSTFTPVVTDAPVQVPVSPATSQSTLNATLVVAAVLSAVVAAYATKRCFEL